MAIIALYMKIHIFLVCNQSFKTTPNNPNGLKCWGRPLHQPGVLSNAMSVIFFCIRLRNFKLDLKGPLTMKSCGFLCHQRTLLPTQSSTTYIRAVFIFIILLIMTWKLKILESIKNFRHGGRRTKRTTDRILAKKCRTIRCIEKFSSPQYCDLK